MVLTGSARITGSHIVTGSITSFFGSSVEFDVQSTGVSMGSAVTDNHRVTGALLISGSQTVTGSIRTTQTILGQHITSLGGVVNNGYGAVGSNYYMDGATLRRLSQDHFAALYFLQGGFVFYNTPSIGNANDPITPVEIARLSREGNFTLTGSMAITGSQSILRLPSNSNFIRLDEFSGNPAIRSSRGGTNYSILTQDGNNSLLVYTNSNDGTQYLVAGFIGNIGGNNTGSFSISNNSGDFYPNAKLYIRGHDSTGASPAIEVINSNGTTIYQLFNDGRIMSREVFNRQTSNYTLVLSDAGKTIEMNSGSANTLTIPTNASVSFLSGSKINIVQYGAGQTTITGSVNIRSANGWLKINAQYGAATLVKIGGDEWYLYGNLNA
jgi:hypothetical protein